jgi:hypothetical protein
MIQASEMRQRCTAEGIYDAMVDNYIDEINTSLKSVWDSPSHTRYVARRIYNVGLSEENYDKAVTFISDWYKRYGYKTTFTQENLLKIMW